MKDSPTELIQRANICVKVSRALLPEANEDLIEDLSVFLMHIPFKELEKMYDRINEYRNEPKGISDDTDGSV